MVAHIQGMVVKAAELQDAHVHLSHEVVRQPGGEQRERVAVAREPDGQSPDFPAGDDVAEHSAGAARALAFGRGAAVADVVVLVLRQRRVFARVAVDQQEGEEVAEAQAGDAEEGAAPAEGDGDEVRPAACR